MWNAHVDDVMFCPSMCSIFLEHRQRDLFHASQSIPASLRVKLTECQRESMMVAVLCMEQVLPEDVLRYVYTDWCPF